MSLFIGFIYITFLSFMATCFYSGIKTIYNKIKKDGFISFLRAFFFMFVAITIVYLLSVKIGNTLLGEDIPKHNYQVRTI